MVLAGAGRTVKWVWRHVLVARWYEPVASTMMRWECVDANDAADG